MNYEAVFNVFLGMLALLGCTPVILFLIVFREQKTIHPIYRSVASLAEPDSKPCRSNSHQPRWTRNKLGPMQENINE